MSAAKIESMPINLLYQSCSQIFLRSRDEWARCRSNPHEVLGLGERQSSRIRSELNLV